MTTEITNPRLPGSTGTHAGNGGVCPWYATARIGEKDGYGAIPGQPGQSPTSATMKAGQESLWLVAGDFGLTVPVDAKVVGVNFVARVRVTAGNANISRVAIKLPGDGFKEFPESVGNIPGAWTDIPFHVGAEALDPGQDLDPAIARRIISDPAFAFAVSVKAGANNTRVEVDSIEAAVVYETADQSDPPTDPDPGPTMEERLADLEQIVAEADGRVSQILASIEDRLAALEKVVVNNDARLTLLETRPAPPPPAEM